MKDELEERLKYPELLGADSRPIGSEHQYQAFQDAARRVAEAKLVVLELPDAELIDLDNATCSYAEDTTKIRAAISGHEPAICRLVVRLLRDAFCGISQVSRANLMSSFGGRTERSSGISSSSLHSPEYTLNLPSFLRSVPFNSSSTSSSSSSASANHLPSAA